MSLILGPIKNPHATSYHGHQLYGRLIILGFSVYLFYSWNWWFISMLIMANFYTLLLFYPKRGYFLHWIATFIGPNSGDTQQMGWMSTSSEHWRISTYFSNVRNGSFRKALCFYCSSLYFFQREISTDRRELLPPGRKPNYEVVSAHFDLPKVDRARVFGQLSTLSTNISGTNQDIDKQ